MDTLVAAVGKFTSLSSTFMLEHLALHAGGEEFIKRAKAAIGTYEYGWPPLAARTIERKGADTPLLETGAMRESGFYEVRGTSFIAGFSDEKIVYHEYGTSHVPPRPVVGGTIDHHGKEIAHHMAGAVGMAIERSLIFG